jgi:hypothetical protein
LHGEGRHAVRIRHGLDQSEAFAKFRANPGRVLAAQVGGQVNHRDFPPKLPLDGRRLAVRLLNDIWVYDFGSRTTTRTTFGGVNQAPAWTPDGRHIAFSSSQNVTRPTLYWVDPAGGEEPEMLSRDGEVQFPSSWVPRQHHERPRVMLSGPRRDQFAGSVSVAAGSGGSCRTIRELPTRIPSPSTSRRKPPRRSALTTVG